MLHNKTSEQRAGQCDYNTTRTFISVIMYGGSSDRHAFDTPRVHEHVSNPAPLIGRGYWSTPWIRELTFIFSTNNPNRWRGDAAEETSSSRIRAAPSYGPRGLATPGTYYCTLQRYRFLTYKVQRVGGTALTVNGAPSEWKTRHARRAGWMESAFRCFSYNTSNQIQVLQNSVTLLLLH